MRSFAMSTLVTRAQQRADLEGDDHIGPSEWKMLVSEQYGELYGIVADTGLRYFESTATITATGATSYTIPTDHLGTLLVARVDTAGQRHDLREIAPQERARWINVGTGDAVRYEIAGQSLILYPKPSTGTYEVIYIAQPTDLSAALDTDTVDVVNADGEAFLLWGVAVKALAKSDSSVQLAIAERDAARVRLAEWAAERAFLQPRLRVVNNDDGDIFGYGYRDPDWWSYR